MSCDCCEKMDTVIKILQNYITEEVITEIFEQNKTKKWQNICSEKDTTLDYELIDIKDSELKMISYKWNGKKMLLLSHVIYVIELIFFKKITNKFSLNNINNFFQTRLRKTKNIQLNLYNDNNPIIIKMNCTNESFLQKLKNEQRQTLSVNRNEIYVIEYIKDESVNDIILHLHYLINQGMQYN